MKKIISIRTYFNRLGEEIYPDWSTKAVSYFSNRGIKDDIQKKRAKVVYRKAREQIWLDGKVKVSASKRQGFIDPPFAVDDFNFYYSTCSNEDYTQEWTCGLEITKENRGARKRFTFISPIIVDHVEKEYEAKGISTSRIKAESVVNYIQNHCSKKGLPKPSRNTVIDYLHREYPECKRGFKKSRK